MIATQRIVPLAAILLAAASLPWLYGQGTSPAVSPSAKSTQSTPSANSPGQKRHDLKRMTYSQQHLFVSAQRAADWLSRHYRSDGRFTYGFSPSLWQPLEEESYLAQIEATFALARAARFFANHDANMKARQALLTLLMNTTTDPQDKRVRYTVPPSNFVNRPAAAGLLILAISELPSPPEIGKDLLDCGDELANFLQRQLRADGSVAMMDSADELKNFSGPALLGIVRSHSIRPAAWKVEAVRKALPHYQSYWHLHKNIPMIAEHSATFTEAFLFTRDQAFADFVFEMNDWLLSHQYQNLDSSRPQWHGGFKPWIDGKAVSLAPNARSALAARSMAEACRVAQHAGDLGRLRRYRESLETCLKFLTPLQYTEANTQHFAESHRAFLVGGFHASSRDGDLRIDYTVHALTVLLQYLEQVAELP